MSHDLYTYGSTDPIYFKITDTNGQGVEGLTFQPADIQVCLVTAGNKPIAASPGWQNASTIGTIGEMVGSSAGKGWYYWEPSASARTQGEVVIINILDDVPGDTSVFMENGLLIATGGDASARFSG